MQDLKLHTRKKWYFALGLGRLFWLLSDTQTPVLPGGGGGLILVTVCWHHRYNCPEGFWSVNLNVVLRNLKTARRSAHVYETSGFSVDDATKFRDQELTSKAISLFWGTSGDQEVDLVQNKSCSDWNINLNKGKQTWGSWERSSVAGDEFSMRMTSVHPQRNRKWQS